MNQLTIFDFNTTTTNDKCDICHLESSFLVDYFILVCQNCLSKINDGSLNLAEEINIFRQKQ